MVKTLKQNNSKFPRDNPKFPNGFCLENFIQSYVHEALMIAKETPDIDYFDAELRGRLSAKINVSKETIKFLHHTFHWAFFNNRDNSIFEYVQVTELGKKNYVRLKKEFPLSARDNISSFISSPTVLLKVLSLTPLI